MPKLCSAINCNTPVFSKGLCQYHWKGWKAMQQSLTQTDNEPAQPFKITPISKNLAEVLKKYRRLRDKYFEEHPVCEFPGCHSRNITLHHKRGRIGAFLTDKRHFCSLCVAHHRWVNENPVEAAKMNLVESRLSK